MTEAVRPQSQITKPDASGKATRWQGYAALLGFGMTRAKNQISDKRPVTGSSHSTGRQRFLGELLILPVFGQRDGGHFLLKNDTTAPPES